MINTYNTLKHVTSVALILLGVVASENAVAIGLGDMDVKSNLGQPFRAKVKVHGINSLNDESCFKLFNSGDGSDSLKSANFKLTNLAGEDATLLVSSNLVINDPILNVSLIAECDSSTSVRRDYVLLIDPLLTVENDSSNVTDEMIASVANKPISVKTKRKASKQLINEDTPDVTTQAQAVQDITAIKPNKHHQTASSKQLNSANQSGRILNDDLPPVAKNTVVPSPIKSEINSNSNIVKKISTDSNKQSMPHLSISGGSFGRANVNDHSLALQLDTQLHMTPIEDPHAFSSEAEVLDEVTVMNNRLAHLEKQLVTLQSRNTSLELADKAHLLQIEEDKEQTNMLRWLAYLFGACALLGIAAGADWWRRRNQRLKLDIDSAWNYMDHGKDDALYQMNNADEAQLKHDIGIDNIETTGSTTGLSELDDFDKTVITPAFMTNKVESVIIEEDILDHADVFLSHGRTNLAIQLLQNHLYEYPNRSVTVWLFLLDLLAKEGAEEEYEMASLECKKHFNIELPEFSTPLARDGKGIESFGAITSHLTHVWQTDEAVPFIDNLIYNNRLQPRAGFNQSTFEELALLKGIAQEHQQTAQIIPLFQKAPTIKIVGENPTAKIKEVEKDEAMTMPPILLPEDLEATPLETTEEKSAQKPDDPDDLGLEFNLVEWK